MSACTAFNSLYLPFCVFDYMKY